MKILYYDCFSGISGDMNLGAMLDLGVEKDFLVNELEKLNVKGWALEVVKDQRHGISGTKVTVKQTHPEHKSRHLSDIEKIIDNSELDKKTRELSKKIFMKVAVAESRVHNVPVEEVHFHEVGAIDSIIDTVGAAICFNSLNVGAVFVGPVELGGGLVNSIHGQLPVPAPATAEIIKGIQVKKDGIDFEATTPTGAAILSAIGTHFTNLPDFLIEKTGYGVGHKDHAHVPNLLRVFLGESHGSQPGHDALLIECNIDDMNPEFYDFISEKLFDAGASDVFITSIIMKKGRPGNILNVICESGLADQLKAIIFTESTSVGIRTFPFRKDTLTRKFEIIQTVYGAVTIKRSYFMGREVSCKPEYNDCRRIALERDIPVKDVFNKIMTLLVNN
jgi:uncharacterized protein (TIGR00299 family) protein